MVVDFDSDYNILVGLGCKGGVKNLTDKDHKTWIARRIVGFSVVLPDQAAVVEKLIDLDRVPFNPFVACEVG